MFKKNLNTDIVLNLFLVFALFVLTLLFSFACPRVFPSYGAKLEQAELQIELFENALEKYFADFGAYPSKETGLASLVNNKSKDGESFLDDSKLPLDPWGNDYQYRIPGVRNKERYDLWSFGADGRAGGGAEDRDITNW